MADGIFAVDFFSIPLNGYAVDGIAEKSDRKRQLAQLGDGKHSRSHCGHGADHVTYLLFSREDDMPGRSMYHHELVVLVFERQGRPSCTSLQRGGSQPQWPAQHQGTRVTTS